MKVRILGQMLLTEGDRSAQISAAKPRKVLALLLLNANRVVPVSALMTELWDTAPPGSAMTTLQTYVLQIRKSLACLLQRSGAEVGRDVLITRNGGYMLKLPHGSLDLHEFERLSAEGRHAAVADEDCRAAVLLTRALALWQGPALVDVKAGPLIEVEVRRLEESKLTVLQQRIDVELRLNHHQEVLSELTALAFQHPLHENLNAQYMLALHRAGRRTDALGVFQRLRRTLVEELGLEPSVRLQRLHQFILSSDPMLEEPIRGDGMLLDRFAGIDSTVGAMRASTLSPLRRNEPVRAF
ncbi:AfsR/SARP family transcriptional regulator [Micromonospora sp. PTRAS2]